MSRESAVGISAGYGLDGRQVGVRFFCSPRLPDLFWGPPPSCSIGTGGCFPVNMIIHFQLVPRLRKFVDLYVHSSIRLHDVLLN
jgi:hypothetical protein